jgi:hypothetical protein
MERQCSLFVWSISDKEKSFITLAQGVAAMGGVGEPEDHVSIKTGQEPTPRKLLDLPANNRLGCLWLAVTNVIAYNTALKLSLKSFKLLCRKY